MTTFDRLLFVFMVLVSIPAILLLLGFIILVTIAAPKLVAAVVIISVATYYSTFYFEKKGFRF